MKQYIIRAFPPNWSDIAKAFPWIKGQQGILYSWGDRLYNPSGIKVPPQLIAHEAVHGERQEDTGLDGGGMISQWWEDYLANPAFRFREEILAHCAEWAAYKGRTPELYLESMAQRLSGKLYGNLCTPAEARRFITESDTP